MAKTPEYRAMDMSGLRTVLNDLEGEYFDLKFQTTLSKLENVALIKMKRRDIARVKTIIGEKESQEKGKA